MQANKLDSAETTLTRKHKAQRRYEVGVGTGVTPSSPEGCFTMKP